MLLLFMHVLTHALFAAVIVFCYKDVRELSIPKKIIIMLLGGFAGILPDLLGFRSSTPWSHSIFIAPLIVLPVVAITKYIFKQFNWWKLWLSLSAATIFGHIIIDFLTHEVTLLYPFSKKEYEWIIFEAGDPWVWLPLLIALAFIIFSSKHAFKSILIVLLVVTSYLGMRAYSKYELIAQLEDYYDEANAIIVVSPPAEILINIKNPLDYLQWSYDLYSEQRSIRGFNPLFGESLETHVNLFYPEPVPIEVNEFGVSRPGGGLALEVLKEMKENNTHYLICKEINADAPIVFRKETDGKWHKVEGAEMQQILSHLNDK